MSGQIFVSHVEEDAGIALAIVDDLEAAGYATWCYERDALPGPSYLLQTAREVEESAAVVLLISPNSLGSRQVTAEVVRSHESGRPFIPVLIDISHAEFAARQPEWREALGSATSIVLPGAGVEAIMPRIRQGLEGLGITAGNGAVARRPRVYAQAAAAPRPVAGALPKAAGRRGVILALAGVAIVVLVTAGVALAGRGGGDDEGGGNEIGATATTTTFPPPTSASSAAPRPQVFASAVDTPVSTSAGSLTVSDVALAQEACPPPGIPGDCLSASGSDRYLVVHLVPAGGGSAAMTQVFTMEAHQSSLTFGGGLQAGVYIVSLDSGANRIEIVYGVLPASARDGDVLLQWPGNKSLVLPLG